MRSRAAVMASVVSVLLLAGGARDAACGGKPPSKARPPKSAGDARAAVLTWLEKAIKDADARRDGLAGHVLASVRVHLGAGEVRPLPASDAPPDDAGWLEKAIAAVAPSVDFLGRETAEADFVAGQMVRQIPVVVKALRALDGYRRSARIPAARFDAAKSVGCILHTRYLIKNGYEDVRKRIGTPHDEREGDPHYTAAGRDAAHSACLGRTDLPTGVEQGINSYYHRPVLLDPRDGAVAFGWWQEGENQAYCLLPCRDAGEEYAGDLTVCFPGPGAKEVPPGFAPGGERPPPVPDMDPNSLGQPVTVTFFGRPGAIEDFRMEVLEGAQPVRGVASSPQHPSNPAAVGLHSDITAGFLPSSPLRSRTTYQVRARAVLAGAPWEKSWSFTTR